MPSPGSRTEEICAMSSNTSENNTNIHERFVYELKSYHSFAAFMKLLECGREFELLYNGRNIGITRNGNSYFISTEKNSIYNCPFELILKANIEEHFIVDIWNDIEIVVIF